MSKFKVGDKVRRIEHPTDWCPLGYEATVATNYEYEDILGGNVRIIDYQWELIEDTSKHHKHHDLIIQWAKGAEVEVNIDGFWYVSPHPYWDEDCGEYRIKPTKPKTDKERIAELEARVQELEGKLNEKTYNKTEVREQAR